MALSLRSCQRARRKDRAARWSSGGHQYFPCCLESIRSNTTWRQLHSPSRNSYRLKKCIYILNPDAALQKLICFTTQFIPLTPPFHLWLPGWGKAQWGRAGFLQQRWGTQGSWPLSSCLRSCSAAEWGTHPGLLLRRCQGKRRLTWEPPTDKI